MNPLERLVLASLPLVPTPVMRRLASRYIAGEDLADALAVLDDLAGRGHPGIVDILGEHVESEQHARAVADAYVDAGGAVAERGLDAYLSIKPTHVGLGISEDLCHDLYARIAESARDRGLFVRVEMEDHPTVDGTLRVFERLRARFDNVGVVLQSRLFRTPRDIRALAPGTLNVRMVKGIYLEPATVAHVDAEPIRRAYFECAKLLFDRGAFVGLATHDDVLFGELEAEVERRGLSSGDYEVQVLLGVREPLWTSWREAGHRVRVYVPYGPEWRSYSLRRLRKNPEILRHVTRNAFRLGRG